MNTKSTYSNLGAPSTFASCIWASCVWLTLALAKFLANNYRQALGIISDVNQTLPKVLKKFSITSKVILEEWSAEEKAYLQSLRHEPPQETLKMEYLHRLVKLSCSQ